MKIKLELRGEREDAIKDKNGYILIRIDNKDHKYTHT
jgi:hypothetical protein